MNQAVLFGVCVAISVVAIRFGMVVADRLGIMDSPGGHKQHEASTPFVGGFGIVAVLVVVDYLVDRSLITTGAVALKGVLTGAVAIFCIGLADDIWHFSFKSRLLVQAVVALSAIILGGMELHSLGELWPGEGVDLGAMAIPLTVIATIGLINAVNMIDGIDGLSGSVSFASLALMAAIAQQQQNGAAVLLLAVMGGVGGFLVYNLRYPGNRRARVFLGDNGSMLLGFVLAWLFISLSQGTQPMMTPVTALWLFALPLMDTVGVMLRRLWLGKSPFRADRSHLHHLFLRAGYRVPDIVSLAFLMQIVMGAIGIAGLLLGAPEYLMFWLFLLAFAFYLLLVARPWRFIPWLERLNRRLGLSTIQVSGIFVGYLRLEQYREILGHVAGVLGNRYGYQVSVYQTERGTGDGRDFYCVVHVPVEGNDQLIGFVHRDARRLRRRLSAFGGVFVRLFLGRRDELDAAGNWPHSGAGDGNAGGERRGARSVLVYSAESGDDLLAGAPVGFEVSVPPA